MLQTISKLWAFSRRRHRNLGLALLFSFLRSSLAITQLIAVIAAVRVVTGSLDAKSGIFAIIVLTLICVIGGFLTSYFEQIHSLTAGMYTVADQRTAAAARLRQMPLGFFRRARSEKLIASLTTTLQGVETASTMTMVGIVSGFFNAAALFVFMLFYAWPIALIMGTGIVVYLLIVHRQMIVSRRDAPARQAAQTDLTAAALTFLQGIRVIKSNSFGRGDAVLKASIDASCRENIRLTNRSMPTQFASHLTIAVFESLLLLSTLYCTFVTGEFSVEKAVILLIFSFMAYAALNQAGSILSMIGMLESGLDEIAEIEEAPVLPRSQSPAVPKDDEVAFHDVHFSYGDRPILKGISAVCKPFELTAVIGPSGSGKTTLCRLISRFQDVNAGSITIGGADVRSIPQEDLMERISIVFQNVYLFEDTILNNIRFGKPDATLEEVRSAAKQARCDDFIMALPQGYDTLVLEGGSNLSGGEKQRISIARAILKDSPIILLDEATSALDAENERAFFDAVDSLTQKKTVIMIAHRLSTVKRANQILALKDGVIVQSGTPEELEKEPGLYADFLASRESAALWSL